MMQEKQSHSGNGKEVQPVTHTGRDFMSFFFKHVKLLIGVWVGVVALKT